MSKRAQTSSAQDSVAEHVVIVRYHDDARNITSIFFLADLNTRQLELLRRLDGKSTLSVTEDDSSEKVLGELLAFFAMIGVEMSMRLLLRDDDVAMFESMDIKDLNLSDMETACLAQRDLVLKSDTPVRLVQDPPFVVTEMFSFTNSEIN